MTYYLVNARVGLTGQGGLHIMEASSPAIPDLGTQFTRAFASGFLFGKKPKGYATLCGAEAARVIDVLGPESAQCPECLARWRLATGGSQ